MITPPFATMANPSLPSRGSSCQTTIRAGASRMSSGVIEQQPPSGQPVQPGLALGAAVTLEDARRVILEPLRQLGLACFHVIALRVLGHQVTSTTSAPRP